MSLDLRLWPVVLRFRKYLLRTWVGLAVCFFVNVKLSQVNRRQNRWMQSTWNWQLFNYYYGRKHCNDEVKSGPKGRSISVNHSWKRHTWYDWFIIANSLHKGLYPKIYYCNRIVWLRLAIHNVLHTIRMTLCDDSIVYAFYIKWLYTLRKYILHISTMPVEAGSMVIILINFTLDAWD